MGERNQDVDRYIEAAADFARPILEKLRELAHQACPELEETIKWRVPHFEHRGILFGMAAFRHSVGLGFPKSGLMADPAGLFGKGDEARGYAWKPRSLDDLPEDEVVIAYIREAARLNVAGVRKPRPAAGSRPEPEVPADLATALAGHAAARETFENFSPSHRREYVEWITEAKREDTRARRLATTLEWLAEGKPRHWKYQKK